MYVCIYVCNDFMYMCICIYVRVCVCVCVLECVSLWYLLPTGYVFLEHTNKARMPDSRKSSNVFKMARKFLYKKRESLKMMAFLSPVDLTLISFLQSSNMRYLREAARGLAIVKIDDRSSVQHKQ